MRLIYVDYGNDEIVPISETRAISSKFCQLPAQALYCSLLMQNETVTSKLSVVLQQWLSHTIVGLPTCVMVDTYGGENNAVVDIEISASFLLSEPSLKLLEESCGVLPGVNLRDDEMISLCKVLGSLVDRVKALQHVGVNTSDTQNLGSTPDCSVPHVYSHTAIQKELVSSASKDALPDHSCTGLLCEEMPTESCEAMGRCGSDTDTCKCMVLN